MRKPLSPTLTRLVAVFALLSLFMFTPAAGWSSWPGETVRAAAFEETVLFQEEPSEEESVSPEPQTGEGEDTWWPEPVGDPSTMPEPEPQTEPLPDEAVPSPAPIDEHLEHPEWSVETRQAAQLVDRVAREIEAEMKRKNDQVWSDVKTLSRMFGTRFNSLQAQATSCFATAVEAGAMASACHCYDGVLSAIGEDGSLHVVYIHEIDQRISDYDRQGYDDLRAKLVDNDSHDTLNSGVMADVGLTFDLSGDETQEVLNVARDHNDRLLGILVDGVEKLQGVRVINESTRFWSASIRALLDSAGCVQ